MQSNLKLPECALHPNEIISGATLDPEATQVLFCDKCLLSTKTKPAVLPLQSYLTQSLQLDKSLSDVVLPLKAKGGLPEELKKLLHDESEIFSRLSVCIETEKSKVVAHYEALRQEILTTLEENFKEALARLDIQVRILESNFFSLRNESDFAFNGVIKTPFESLDEAIMKINKIASERELTTFIQNLNFQLKQKSELQNVGSKNIDNYMTELQRSVLEKAKIMMPLMNSKHLPSIQLVDKEKWDCQLKPILESFSKALKELNYVSHPLRSIHLPQLATLSSIVSTAEEEKLVSQAICKSGKAKYELVYKGSRDGYHFKDFKKHWSEGQGPLLLVIESTTGSRFGAYTENLFDNEMDKFTFLFSFDRKEIYTVSGSRAIAYYKERVQIGDLVLSGKRFDVDKSSSVQYTFFCKGKVLHPYDHKNPHPFLNIESHTFVIKEIEAFIAKSNPNDVSDTRVEHNRKAEGVNAFSQNVMGFDLPMFMMPAAQSNLSGGLFSGMPGLFNQTTQQKNQFNDENDEELKKVLELSKKMQ